MFFFLFVCVCVSSFLSLSISCHSFHVSHLCHPLRPLHAFVAEIDFAHRCPFRIQLRVIMLTLTARKTKAVIACYSIYSFSFLGSFAYSLTNLPCLRSLSHFILVHIMRSHVVSFFRVLFLHSILCRLCPRIAFRISSVHVFYANLAVINYHSFKFMCWPSPLSCCIQNFSNFRFLWPHTWNDLASYHGWDMLREGRGIAYFRWLFQIFPAHSDVVDMFSM